jgi:hypothetical protein
MQDISVQTNIRQHLSAYNDEQTEVSLSAQNAATIAAFMPRFAMPPEVTQAQVDQWYLDNGFGPPVVMPVGN